MDIDKLPSNSENPKQTERQAPAKVASGKVTRKPKPTRLQRAANLIFADDISEVKKSILLDVIIPTAIDMIVNVTKSSVEMLFYGTTSRGGNKNRPQGTYVSYNSYSQPQRPNQRRARNTFAFDEITFDTKEDADNVIDTMCELIDRYGQVSVLEYYDISGVTGNGSTDKDYGWTNLQAARSRRTRDGWIVELPRCVQLD